MRNWRCWFRPHDTERVTMEYPMVIPTVGMVVRYKSDPEGKAVACRRCRKVLPGSQP